MYANDTMMRALALQDDVVVLVQEILNSMIGHKIDAVAVYWHFAQQVFVAQDQKINQNLRDAVVTAVMRGDLALNEQEPIMVPTRSLIAFGSRRGTIGLLMKDADEFDELFLIGQYQLLAIALAWGELLFLQKRHKLEAINAMLGMLDMLDVYTLSHSKNVANYALLFAEELRCTPRETEIIYYGAMFHDLGKIGTPSALLRKDGELTPEELEMIQSHSVKGVALLQNFSDFQDMLPIIKYHHERFDGGGYPMGLCGEQIPFGARIVSIVDAYDALTNNRSYRNAQAKKQAIATIKQNASTQFDPELVEVFAKIANNL